MQVATILRPTYSFPVKDNNAPSDVIVVRGSRLLSLALFILAGAVCAASVTGLEVPAKPSRTRVPRSAFKNVIEESGRGAVAGLHRNTTPSKKLASIDLQLDGGAQVSLDILPTSQLGVLNATLPPDRVFALLTSGVPIEATWTHSKDDDKRSVVALMIRTVQVEGVIKKVGGGRMTARVKVTRAGGAPVPLMLPQNIQTTQPTTEPERDLTFKLQPEVLKVTQDGRKSDLRRIRANLHFKGTAMDGGTWLLFTLDAAELPRNGPRKPFSEKRP